MGIQFIVNDNAKMANAIYLFIKTNISKAKRLNDDQHH